MIVASVLSVYDLFSLKGLFCFFVFVFVWFKVECSLFIDVFEFEFRRGSR